MIIFTPNKQRVFFITTGNAVATAGGKTAAARQIPQFRDAARNYRQVALARA
jgi:hypothetical protein